MSQQPVQTAEPSIRRGPAGATGALADNLSAMTPRFNFLAGWFARRFFGHFELAPETVALLRDLQSHGSVVYVMRYASRLDYFLFNALLLREGLGLSRFANGIRFHYYRPIWEWLKIALLRRRGMPQVVEHERARAYARTLTQAGEPFFLFLRTARPLSWLRGRRGAALEGKSDFDLLEEVVRTVWRSQSPVHLVPLALFWRKGPRARRRFLNLSYGARTRPSDLAKVTSFLTTYRDLSVRVGEPIDLTSFIAGKRDKGPEAVTRKVRRAILLFLSREEKVVEGPTLRSLHEVQETVLAHPGVAEAIEERTREKRIPLEVAREEAANMVREIAANMNSTFLAVLNAAVQVIMRRLFARIEVSGLDKVAGYAKRHPLVLVPSHRSYFDFVILSSLFYSNHLVPPHIAARENMAFGPFGFLWRRCGAFFLRRSFDDPLYKRVFRAYVAHLISEGFTQEFFIEGGRSRTGKTLAPRLGMLSWNVEAFLDSRRRDLFFVPIAITYERLVEEGAMVGELEGEKKRDESMLGLVRARKYLQRRFGSVFVSFGEPISLASAMGPGREQLSGESEDAAAERRTFIEGLGNRIAERINWAVVANATSVAACALLGERRRGLLRGELVQRMQQVVDLLRLQDVRLTPALEADEGDFAESIATLLRTDLLQSETDARGEILYYEDAKVRALDLYRNAITHFLAAPSFLARRLLSRATEGELRADLATWLDVFYYELFTPRAEVLAVQLDAFLDHFERLGFVGRSDGHLQATEKGLGYFRFLAEQTRGLLEVYYATLSAVLGADAPVDARALTRAAGEQFERARLLGEVDRRESAHPIAFANALDLLVRRGMLVRAATPSARERRVVGVPAPSAREGRVVAAPGPSAREGRVVYERGPAFSELAPLRERLAAALHAR
jgi:glycerol-3-phosphate O-acyltransferase